jgi:queuine/archaeosine tRNA-ribosyltransferase
MKFIYSDALDMVDPGFDFVRDSHAAKRNPYWDDQFAHEIFKTPPYDGMLISRAIVGGTFGSGKYSDAQARRLRREGARSFLRLTDLRFASMPIFGDCGAFSYHAQDVPPYSPDDMLGFYDDGRFDFGCSVDHVIFDFDESSPGLGGGSAEAQRRFDITLENADAFFRSSTHMSAAFTPLGVIQGWSPDSMAEAARRLVAMGYDYLALGGTVPLKTPQIKAAVEAIRGQIPAKTRLHILGFAKAEEIEQFTSSGITSFDTTSPLIRAFKDAKSNYYLRDPGRGMRYYTAVRVPQALENPKLLKLAKEGAIRQDELVKLERQSLQALRSYDRLEAPLDQVVDAVLAYSAPATLGMRLEHLPGARSLSSLRQAVTRTLADRPWDQCGCTICRSLSIEVVIFRGSNRNKRRGMHNMRVYHDLVANVRKGEMPDRGSQLNESSEGNPNEADHLQGHQGAPEQQARSGLIRCESV